MAGFLCVVLLAGCSEKDNIPSGVLGKEEMGNLIWDMMQADQYASTYLIKDSSKVNVKMETLKLYEEVFRLHKVTREDFRKSFQFYQDHPDITRTILDSLTSRGNRMRAESYTHSPYTATSVPPARPATTGPGAHPPVVAPGKSPIGTNKPPGLVPGTPTGVVPGKPGSFHPPHGFPMRNDSLRFHRMLPPPGVIRPAQAKDTTKH
jgi:hypothetical protein